MTARVCAAFYAHLAANRARCREKYGREFKNAAMGIGIVVWAFGIGAFTMSASVAPKLQNCSEMSTN